MRHRRFGTALASSVLLLVVAACGTRLPNSAFSSQEHPTTGASSPTGASSSPTASDDGNTASAVGVTPTTITIGQIASITNPFDPESFVGPEYGLQAFVRYTNAHGGIHGRQLVLHTCDDQGSSIENNVCAHTLIDKDHVFALVSNAAIDYAGAGYVNSQNVPDIGAQPIDNSYVTYHNLFDLYGESYPRNGKPGLNGMLYGGTEVYRFFKVHFPHVPLKAGVVEYNQSDSERYGNSIAEGLRLEGYSVLTKVVNFALPDWNAVAIAFKHAGVQYVYDALDNGGNEKLCAALDDNDVSITAKVLTTQAWNQSVNSEYAASPHCRNELWVTGNTRNYEDTKYHQVALFRQQMSADGDGGAKQLSEWALEAWAGALWFADAAQSCGADLTRPCVEKYMYRKQLFTGDGLLTPRGFSDSSSHPSEVRNCLNVARWNSAKDSWVTQVPNMDTNCFRVPNFSYAAD
ncbi:MAG TPA: ABC transporter substrate-binding protein [Mycobacteriales bacterium]|nr:ABC transporter substrate-binding protein [Mycobacteriales bacterium]